MLIWTLQYNTSPFMLNKQKISFKLAASLCKYASCLSREPLCLSRLPGTTHVSERFLSHGIILFDVESVFRDEV